MCIFYFVVCIIFGFGGREGNNSQMLTGPNLGWLTTKTTFSVKASTIPGKSQYTLGAIVNQNQEKSLRVASCKSCKCKIKNAISQFFMGRKASPSSQVSKFQNSKTIFHFSQILHLEYIILYIIL